MLSPLSRPAPCLLFEFLSRCSSSSHGSNSGSHATSGALYVLMLAVRNTQPRTSPGPQVPCTILIRCTPTSISGVRSVFLRSTETWLHTASTETAFSAASACC